MANTAYQGLLGGVIEIARAPVLLVAGNQGVLGLGAAAGPMLEAVGVQVPQLRFAEVDDEQIR